MASEPVLHSLTISQVMLNYAEAHGVSADDCLAGTGITLAMLQDPDALITPEQEMRLIENLMLALPDIPALGFELGMQYNVSTFGTWGFALRTSRNLREALERAIRYLPLSTAYCSFVTTIEADEFVVSADPSSIPAHLRQFLLERDLGTAVNLTRELNLAGRSIIRLELIGPALPYQHRIKELLAVPVHFNAGRNALVLSASDVIRSLPTFDEHLVRLLEDQCGHLLASRKIGGLPGQVRQHLLGSLGLLASLDDVAKVLNTSPRNLRRKLEAEGTSFRALVEEARQQLATQLLSMTSMKLDEIALHLGYADTASFARAFRRWQGVAPGQFRLQGKYTGQA
ncbi:MAG: AraC family transcriptional regulator [Moraxellaceae bacterium]|nr:AraC family transcriptional regulator [Moraxellaceae bacterium]MDZ4299134.1 AraC family transcriptional regulator [Moraxellaceae bacterium]MDZ4386256.1 AraC family transcriptional regulator [Moraxellaceae bacterium]